MTPFIRRAASLCLGTLASMTVMPGPASAQYEIESGVYNRLSQRIPPGNPAQLAPLGPAISPAGPPLLTPQFSNVVEAGGSAGPIPSGYPSALTNDGGVILQSASIGTTFASGVPRYSFGDAITAPTSIVNAAGVKTSIANPATFWRAEPVAPGENLFNPSGAEPVDYRTGAPAAVAPLPEGVLPDYYYSPHARRVFANTPGKVSVTWRSSLPDPATNSYIFYQESFVVSSATSTPVRTIFWTEKSFNGPRVTIPSGRIVTVNPVYSNVFPETVSEEYVVVGSSKADPNSTATEILRTLWFEKTNGIGELHAYNQTGRILVEYLGNLLEDGTHEFLGADIVNVEQAARPKTLTVELGREIRPQPDENLIAFPVSSSDASDQVSFYGSISRPDGSLAYYAERENDIEDRVVFYWLESLDAAIGETEGVAPGIAIRWPKSLNKYLQVWPADVTSFASYTVATGGSSVENGMGLKFEGGRIPKIVYQDDPSGAESFIDTISQRLVVGLGTGGDQANRTLLKFTGDNGGVWYVNLLTQAAGSEGFMEGDGGAPLTGNIFVGDRIEPPPGDYSKAGYIASGTCYSPAAYIDPFVAGETAARAGAIIPVNAIPGANDLSVWWLKRVKAPSAEFSDFYTPAKVGRYTVAYRLPETVAADDFDGAPSGWSSEPLGAINGVTGTFLGPFGKTAQPSTGRTFDMLGRDANNVNVSFYFHRFDSWDSEKFRVFLNGNMALEQVFTHTKVSEALGGSSTYGNIRYDWTMIPVAGSYVNYFGAGWNDQAFQVTITASSTSDAPAAALTLEFGSSLDSSASDESFGIDRLRIEAPLADRIVLASNQGSGSLPAEIASGGIYNQPDPAKPGYNPNEEHALLLGGRAYALRDDLNLVSGDDPGVSFTSLPRVLVSYKDKTDGRPAMRVFEVLREDALHKFSYPVVAGTILSAPMPLPLLPLPLDSDGKVRNTEVPPDGAYQDTPAAAGAPSSYTPFTYIDRKGYTWVYRGPHDDGTPALGMQYYYTMRGDFVFPNREQPAVGTPLPYLRNLDEHGTPVGDPVTGTPLTVSFHPEWPENPPTLQIGETLALPKRGLPAVRGQTSANVIYQQSLANQGAQSVVLHDPTRAKTVLLNNSNVGLTALPASLKTTVNGGKTFFQLAQPHLQQRFYLDPTLGNIGGLVLTGEFVDEIAGEDYLNLNALSPADIAALKILVDSSDKDKARWDSAIDALSTTMETFVENPASRGTYIVDSGKSVGVAVDRLPEVTDSDTAVDSYALTATGAGSGYVTLLFADGSAFTPKGEPVAIQVIRVVPELYQGDIRKISASNPLDEQTTLRHSGDFAAHPENYQFEWCYSLPVNGLAPAVYSTTMQRVVGGSGTNSWYLLANPAVLPPAAADYPTTAVTLERAIQINNSDFEQGSGRPGQMLRSVTGLSADTRVPSQIVFSAKLEPADGFVLYVNDVPALAYQLPPGVGAPGGLIPQAPRSGLAADGLTYQFELDRSLFNTGTNSLAVALYSQQAPGGPSSLVDFRVNVPVKEDLVKPPAGAGTPWIAPVEDPPGSFSNTLVIGGAAGTPLGDPLLVFSDSYFTMRYRAKDSAGLVTGDTWSEWSDPVLVESWVKRVLDGINPFNQRQTDLYNNPVSTDVSILTQAGKRWEGDVALNLENINDFGLIEIYETVLNRVKKQSLDAGVTSDSVNNTLLLVAGYLNDLYMTLGNEAFDDARNPTLQVESGTEIEDVDTARFSFEGQVATMMEETLALLRGRDDFFSPGTRTTPSYNRLYWNYTNGVNSGEPFYAVNYNIREQSGGAYEDGTLDASDAQWMFPQGHGDAYGHYLTALKGYYKLLRSPVYTWVPSTETVDVLGQAVQVDYADERKFAAAAAALARTGVDILDFTARRNHRHGEESGWSHMRDGKYNPSTGVTRHWGTDEWSSRAFQGAYYHWVTANAMLPDVDNEHEGIQKIDRTTVPEINELVTSAGRILSLSAGEQAHLNPLGLAADTTVFDISPAALAQGKAHFEQIQERAIQAAVNAKSAFQQASVMNRLLRSQNDTLDTYGAAVSKQESAYEYQLIELYGTPYAGDIGPGKLYAQGYAGPDFYHSYFIDRPSQLVDVSADVTVEFREPVNKDPFREWSIDNVYQRLTVPGEYISRTYRMSPYTLGQFSDTVTGGLGKRSQTGAIQTALLDCYEAQVKLREASDHFSTLMRRFDRDYQLYSEFLIDYDAANDEASRKLDEAAALNKAAFTLATSSAAFALTGDYVRALAAAAAEAQPQTVGFSNDVTSVGRMAALLAGESAGYAQNLLGLAADTSAALLEAEAADLEGQAQQFIDDYNFDSVKKQHVVEFERLYDEVLATAYEISARLTELQRANEQVSKLYGRANHILSERETFRMRSASVIQGYRTNDLVFRELRNEELEQYKSLFDLAQTYAYCAAKAYDYETGLLSSSTGRDFVDEIIQSYSIGAWDGSNPIPKGAGDSGLASILGRLRDDWSVVEGRLGINNPDRNGTLFSLRQELFRIRTHQPTSDDNQLWKQVLQQHIMSNVLNDPDVAIYCNNIRKADGSAVPGIVIPFATTIEPGLNFFGWPLAPGDHAYSQSAYSTKIHSSGVVFMGYVGMDPYAEGSPGAGGPASSDPNALAATPYVYLIPAGLDTMRVPPLGDTNAIRTWDIRDQALPLPVNIGAIPYSDVEFFTPQGTLNEQLWIRRKHQAFRAVDDAAYFYSSIPAEFTNSRLIGRSVWNSRWKIIIPAYGLLNDANAGLDRFTKSVSDIKLFLRTYSNSGN